MALNTPMSAEAVVALLGVLLAGCVAVAVADSFAAAEIASRLRIAGAKAIITQVGGCSGTSVEQHAVGAFARTHAVAYSSCRCIARPTA